MKTITLPFRPATRVIRPATIVSVAILLLLGMVAHANILWEADTNRSTSVFEGLERSPGTITVAGDPLGQYGNVYKYDLPDTNSAFGKERCESRGTKTPIGNFRMSYNTGYYIGWRAMWNPMPINGSWVALFQMHGYGVSGQGAPLVLRCVNGDGNVYFQYGANGINTNFWHTKFLTNVWQSFVVHVFLSTNWNVGYTEIWHNGVQQTNDPNAAYPTRWYGPTWNNVDGVWSDSYNLLKWGVYRSGSLDGKGPATAYMSRARIGTTYADVADGLYALFSVAATPVSQTVGLTGTNVTYTVNVTTKNGFAGNVSFGLSGLPPNTSFSFNPPSLAGAGSSTLTLTTSDNTPIGDYTLQIRATNGPQELSEPVKLLVGDFFLSASPSEQTVSPGDPASYAISVTTSHNFSGNIYLGVSGLPPQAIASFNPSSLAGDGFSTLTIATATNTPVGDYALTIYGTNGASIASTTATLHMAKSLVAWLTFDDGTARDVSGHGNNGVLVNGASVVDDSDRGKVLSLDGANQYVDLGNGPSLNLSLGGQATITAWVKVANIHNHNSILTKGEWKDAYSLLVKGDTTPPNLLWTGNDTSVFSGGSVPTGVWTHVAVTINGALTTFYINGQLSGTTNQNRGNPIDQTTDDVCIGREQYSGSLPTGRWFFNGELDDVRIYNVVLGQSQIQKIMTNLAPSFISHPLIGADATAEQTYSGSLVADVTDPNAGDFLTFSKLIGPGWLNVAAAGDLSGTPPAADAGTNSFVVRVTDSGGLSDEATLTLNVLPVPPRIADFSSSNGQLVFNGTNGVPGWICYVLTSTNLSLPLNQWTVIATNTFDGNGGITFTDDESTQETQRFYLLQLP